MSAPLGGKWSASVEAIGRLPRDAPAAAQVEGQIRAYRELSSRWSLGGGYAHVVSYNGAARPIVDHQIVEELIWTPPAIAGVEITLRNRLEERRVSGVSATSWRFREQLRLKRSLSKVVAVSLWTEPFFSLNRTAAATRTLDQVRSFIGLSLTVNKRATLEVGYLRQDIQRAAGHVGVNAISAVLVVKF